MPRKDPFTGCTVMTLGEFFAAEGEREGKSGSQVMEETFAEMAKAEKEEHQELCKPENALTQVLEIIKNWDDPNNPTIKPKAVLQVLDSRYGAGLGGIRWRLKLRCLREDNSEGIFWINYSHSFGNRTEPPDEEAEFYWIEEHPELCNCMAQYKGQHSESCPIKN